MIQGKGGTRRRLGNALVKIAVLFTTIVVALVPRTVAQDGGANAGGNFAGAAGSVAGYERTYRQSKSAVERALKQLQPSMSGRLPVLEGFATASSHPLNRYQHAFYQCDVQVKSSATGATVVSVSTKVTAWYADPTAGRSGYQLLSSNGRLEADLLDQLTDLLTSNASKSNEVLNQRSDGTSEEASIETFPNATRKATSGKQPDSGGRNAKANEKSEPVLSAPMPSAPESGRTFSSPREPGLTGQQLAETRNAPKEPAKPSPTGLQAEAASLEEVLKNQVHPKNLVAIKKTGTPVVSGPSLTAKTLFLASAEDEFEMLDYNQDWVHVRISGLSRGWIWRTSLEMPPGISDIPTNNTNAVPVAADLFQVTREETAPFPGDWAPLRGKNVKIISVQKIQENEKDSGAEAKLEFAKSLLEKNYADLAAKKQELSGIVMIFDAVDGGMIAATLPTVQQWKAGTLTDAALWHQCYFDPPETFTVQTAAPGH